MMILMNCSRVIKQQKFNMEIQTRRKEVESKLGFAGTIEQKSLTDSIERENKRLEA